MEEGERIALHILTRLRFSNDQIKQVLALVANHMRFSDVTGMKDSTLKRFMRLADFDEHLELHRLDCLSSHRNVDNYEFIRRKREDLAPEQIKPKPLLTGHDLIAAGYQPGPAFATMLAAAEDAQLESRISTREEALELIRSAFGPPQ